MRTHLTPGSDHTLSLTVKVGTGLTSALNLSDYLGRNWVQGITFRNGVDQSVADLELRLQREEFECSLAPLQGNSPANSPAVALQLCRMVFVSVTDGGTEYEIFRGRIDSIDWTGSQIVVHVRDLAGDLQDAFSQYPRIYAIGGLSYGVRAWEPGATMEANEYVGPDRLDSSGESATAIYVVVVGGTFANTAPDPWPTDYDQFTNGTVTLQRVAMSVGVWESGFAYTFGNIVMPTDSGAERMICIRAGTSGASEPTWPANTGETVEDGGACWSRLPVNADGGIALEAVMNEVIRDNVTGAPDIYFPAASGYWKNPMVLEESSVLETLRNLANEVGWDLRVIYQASAADHEVTEGAGDGWGHWRLTLCEPNRAGTTADVTLSASDVLAAERCEQSVEKIRNVVKVTYDDWDNEGQRSSVLVTDATSISKYGERYFGIACGSTNSISRATEATALANAVLSDLKEPELEYSIRLPFRWWPEINDLIGFPATGFPHFNAAQKLAVTSIQHRIVTSGNKLTAQTTLGTRGKPTAGIKGWLGREQGPGRGQPGASFRPQGPGTVTVVPSVRGASLTFEPPVAHVTRGGYGSGADGAFESARLHLSDTQGFTPSDTTLTATTRSNRFDVAGLTTGATKYGRIEIVDPRGNVSVPSPEFTIAPVQAALGDLDDGLKVACMVRQLYAAPYYYDLSNLGVVPFGDERVDDGECWDEGTMKFVAPTAGIYAFSTSVFVGNAASMPDPPEFDMYGDIVGSFEVALALLYERDGEAPISAEVSRGTLLRLRPGAQGYVTCSGFFELGAGQMLSPIVILRKPGGVDVYPGTVRAFLDSELAFFQAHRVWSR